MTRQVRDVYITDIATFLPNDPVGNDQMETVLGMAENLPSRTKAIVLRNNRIRQRYYAIDPTSGELTHTNAQLAAEAIRRLRPHSAFGLDEIECLCCGTSSPDQLMPGHGLMVHGELGNAPCEVISTAGICLSGIAALKYAYMNVALGLCQNGVATGSELASSFLRGSFCRPISAPKVEAVENQPLLGFDEDFLRWMLSDGAGAVFLAAAPVNGRLALRIDWMEHLSHASLLDTCMYAGAVQEKSGRLKGWREFPSLEEAVRRKAFLVKQNVKLLNREIIVTAVERVLALVRKKHQLAASSVDWFLPHYSSEYFRGPLEEHLRAIGFDIPQEKWFTNLETKGNTGSASIYIILEELFHSGKVKRGDRLLCLIPESGRFSMCYMLLTAV
jgi:3-oxoacyl-[acyl-carrier-protein] synthase III